MPAASYAQFMETFAPMGERTQRGKHFIHGGSQPGVETIAIWRGDGTKIVAFFNKKVEKSELKDQLLAAADALSGLKTGISHHH
jgi:hypothetical protein